MGPAEPCLGHSALEIQTRSGSKVGEGRVLIKMRGRVALALQYLINLGRALLVLVGQAK